MKRIGILCVIIAALQILYISQTRQYPQWDEHHYLSIAVKTVDAVHEKGIIGLADIIPISTYRQPFYSLILTLILLVVGTSESYTVALLLNVLFFSFSILGTYALARQFLSNASSIIAAFLFATFGNALFYAHFTYVETATTTMIVWTLYFLKKSDMFQSTRYTLWTTIFFILATLTRFVAPAFLLGPILLNIIILMIKTFFMSFLRRQESIPKVNNDSQINTHYKLFFPQWKNLILFLLCSILIPLFIYFIPNQERFLYYVNANQSNGAAWVAQYRDPAMANTFSLRSITYYVNILQQNTIGIFLLFALGMGVIGIEILKSFFQKPSRFPLATYYFLLTTFLSGYSFLTFLAIWKEDRFLVLLYPIVAIISALLFDYLPRRVIYISLVVITLGVGSLNALGALFGVGPMGQKGLVDYITPKWLPHPRRFYLTPLVWPPTKEYSNADIFVDVIQKDWKQERKATILFTFTHEPFQNAVQSILWYEKRNLAELTIGNEATEASTFDFIVSQKEFTTRPFQVLSPIHIPYDQSTVYVVKNIQ